MADVEDSDEVKMHENDQDEYPISGVHGVLHLMTREHMVQLDRFEGAYVRKVCKVRLYDGTEVNALVYSMDSTKFNDDQKHNLPSERYLDIIAKGCEAHGVNKDWINFISNHACISRSSPTDFRSFSFSSATVPIIKWDEVRRNNGIDSDKLWIVINNKVLEFRGEKHPPNYIKQAPYPSTSINDIQLCRRCEFVFPVWIFSQEEDWWYGLHFAFRKGIL